MRPLSPRRPITGRRGTRQPWLHAFSDIDFLAFGQYIALIRSKFARSSPPHVILIGAQMRQRVARVHLRQLILVSRGDVDADAGGVVGPSLDPADVRGTSGGRRLTIQRRPTLRQGVEPIQSSSP